MTNQNSINSLNSTQGAPIDADRSTNAVSWGAILAGAAAAAALSLILLMLGTGLGLSSVSPWAHNGMSATGLGAAAILWITLTQILASGMGGYLTGRLRTKWSEVHPDEAHFRDTAHGFLAWAVATLATAALLGSVIGSIVGGGIKTGANLTGGAASAAMAAEAQEGNGHPESGGGPMNYFVDSMFRPDPASVGAAPAAAAEAGTTPGASSSPIAPAPTLEVNRIFIDAIHNGSMPAEDTQYVGRLISQRTGLSQQDAEKRVSETFNRARTKLQETEAAAKDAADKGRKASAYTTLWVFISLLIGSFIASLAATIGGRRRDL